MRYKKELMRAPGEPQPASAPAPASAVTEARARNTARRLGLQPRPPGVWVRLIICIPSLYCRIFARKSRHFFENPENPRCRDFLAKILH